MISIIIPAYNNEEKLYKLLNSIKSARKNRVKIEVIVVDDYSPHDLSVNIRKKFDFVEAIRLSQKSGPAFARNKGAELAQGDILMFLDSDVIIKEDTIVKVNDAFLNNNVVALEGEYDTIPANPGFLPRYKALEYRSFVRDQDYISILGPRICAIKRSIFLELKGFIASYNTASVEDYELSYRLQDKGYRIHYDKTLEVKHHFTDSIIKQLNLSFHRTQLWTQLFVKRKKFDNFGTTFSEGLGRLSGFIFIILLPSIFISKYFGILLISLFFAYLFLNRRFFKLIFKEEGMFFLIKSIALHLLISIFINVGFIYGVLSSTLRK